MDTPGVKSPYSAIVTVPAWCTVLMSALSEDADLHLDGASGKTGAPRQFKWKQPVPTAAYLIALAAGHLDYRDISRRVRIWSEPVSFATSRRRQSY
jgi:aminopeptidase N